jgi:hypothetical protein
MRRSALLCFFALAGIVCAQVGEFEGRPAIVLSNGTIQLTVLLSGATLANVALLDDPDRFSPIWNEARAVRLAGGIPEAGAGLGHFLCLDGFGAPSPEELKAHYPFHGEASAQHFEILMQTRVPPIGLIMLGTQLPMAQELVVRIIQMVDGENVAYIETQVDNLLPFDRPIAWAEHATLGPPFLEPGKVIVDMPAGRCRVRAEKPGAIAGRLEPLADFDWPMAPLRKGGSVSLLGVPEEASLDLAGCQILTDRVYGYVTAFRRDKRLLYGYVFHRRDFPWLMSWMNYTGDATAARGIEFSTQPFDVSRRETVDAHEMFGTLTYRWLPAKTKITTRFLLFYTRVPDDFTAVSDVVLEKGRIRINDKTGHSVMLSARLPL